MRASGLRLGAALLLALGAAAAPAQVTRAGLEPGPAPRTQQPPADQAPQQRTAPPAAGEPLPPVPHIPGLTPPPASQPQPQQPRTREATPPADDGASGEFTPPALRAHVTDAAGVLQPQERQALEARLAQLRRESGVQVAVFLPASLQGRTVEDVAYETFNAWGLGEREADNGVLLLIAPRERRVRIETGKGVGGELPDALAGRIIRDAITPRLKEGDWTGGILAGADGIARALTGRGLPEGQVPQGPRGPAAPAPVPVVGCGGSPFACLLFSLFGLFVLSRLFRGPRGPRGRRRGGVIFIPPIFGGGGFGGRGGGGGDGGGFSGGGGESGGGGASGRW